MQRVVITGSLAVLLNFSTMAQDMKVAIFDPAGKIENSLREIVREEISAYIVNIGGYIVLERQMIDKVLEENKFQSGGLVDDSQVSEMGKRMGANLVFVTNLTSMGNGNFYISCKMIDVQTARIDKQKTAQTQKGSNDLIDVIQKVLKDMFGGTSTSSTTQSIDYKKDNKKPKEKTESTPHSLNGHYIGLGSSMLSAGYYGGIIGMSYEYRRGVAGFNTSLGYNIDIWYGDGFAANLGLKLYFSNKKDFLKSFYVNILPLFYTQTWEYGRYYYPGYYDAYLGYYVNDRYESGTGNSLGFGFFIGYSPVWKVSKKVSLGFNFDLGTKFDYTMYYFFPINWDLGLVIKF